MDPRKTHQLEQETGPLHELAYKLGAYLRSLEDQGFTRTEAMQIVIEYQRAIIQSLR